MNNSNVQPTSNPLSKELFVFSPTGGILMNIDPRSLPQHDTDALTKFEIIGTNPLINANKASNFSDYDHYIEDPTNPEIKNAVLNNITFFEGKVCLKKDAVDIIYCSFDAFKNNPKVDLLNSGHIAFYVNMLLLYPPELRQSTLNQYFATLIKILNNDLVPLDSKYLLTFKALEVEWERCSFGKYSLFKSFFMSMKKFYKISPLFIKTPFLDQATTNAHQELLTRILSGRATAILKHIIDCEDPLKLLILFQGVEWMQKLEGLKILQGVNINYLITKGRDNLAIEFLKQMYGKAPLIEMPPKELIPDNRPDNDVVSDEKHVKVSKPVSGKIQSVTSPSFEVRATKKISEDRKQSSDIEIEDFGTNQKTQIAKNKKKEEPINVIEADRKKKEKEPQQEKPIITKQAIQETGKKPKKVKKERIDLFFSLHDINKYEDDFGGRISNFLKKALKMGYEFLSQDQPKIESIISKFRKNYTSGQTVDIMRNYQKFCTEYNVHVNPQIISYFEAETQSSLSIKDPKLSKEENVGSAPQSGTQIHSKPHPSSSTLKQKPSEHKGETQAGSNIQEQKQKKNYAHEPKKQEQTIQTTKREVKNLPQEEVSAEGQVIYCKNPSPMAEQMNLNKSLFEQASRIHEDLERILNKKFQYLKIIKIGSIGCGYANELTDNFNMAMVRKDLAVTVKESQLMEDVFSFLKENYFKEENNPNMLERFEKTTIGFVSKKDKPLKCSIIYDNNNQYRDLTQKIKLILSIQPSILNVFYKLQKELQEKNLLSEEGLPSYLLIIMLITSCQLEFEGKRCLQGLQKNEMQLNQQKISQADLLKRFTTIFHNCIQNEISRNYYFSLLGGCLNLISASKPHFAKSHCLIYLEDPFNPQVNCSKNLDVSGSKGIVEFIERLYTASGAR